MRIDVTFTLLFASICGCLTKYGLHASTILPRTILQLRDNSTKSKSRTSTTTTTEEETNFALTSSCIVAKNIFISELGDDNDYVYNNEQTGTPLKVCGNSKTCCMPQAEKRLHKRSQEQLKGDTKPLHIDLQKYGHTVTTFKHLFRSILDSSYRNLDIMFQRTYQTRYQNNSHVFKSLYKSLHQYFNGSELDLQEQVDHFFEKLFEKIYIMSKPWAVFDKKYEHCIFESTASVKPFGDIQRKVAHQILRSFLASRVFLNGLKEGMEFASQMQKLRLGDGCTDAFMKMTQCSVCSGVPRSVKPCKKYCINVIKGCYVDTIFVQGKWNQFIDSLVALTTKIEGPFSMEAVIEPLGVKISEAIMAFQDNQLNITNKVEARCGKAPYSPSLGGNDRRRRAVAPQLQAQLKNGGAQKLFSDFKSGQQQRVMNELKGDNNPVPSSLSFSPLYNFNVNNQKDPSKFEKMLRETKSSLTDLKDYWVKLSERWCNDERTTEDNSNCWNGRNTSGYHLDVVSDLVKDSENNPEVETELKQNQPLIFAQVSILERSIRLIKSALNGNTGRCVDDCVDDGSGDDGSGEKDGSGDDEGSGGEDKNEGSGSGAGVDPTPEEDACANSVEEDCKPGVTNVNNGPSPTPGNNIPELKFDVRNSPSVQNAGVSLRGCCGTLWLLLLLSSWLAAVL